MGISDGTPEYSLAVPCPTCGVDAGKPCSLHSGGTNPDTHIERTLDAAKAIETKTFGQSGTPDKNLTSPLTASIKS